MGDESSWLELAQTVLSNPEKMALALVLVVGAWRWIRELIKEARGDAQEETLLDVLLRENRELREELRNRRGHEHHEDEP